MLCRKYVRLSWRGCGRVAFPSSQRQHAVHGRNLSKQSFGSRSMVAQAPGSVCVLFIFMKFGKFMRQNISMSCFLTLILTCMYRAAEDSAQRSLRKTCCGHPSCALGMLRNVPDHFEHVHYSNICGCNGLGIACDPTVCIAT